MIYTKDLLIEVIEQFDFVPEVTAFYGYEHPFSNFHPCTFSNNEWLTFSSTEQFLMYSKARLFDDYDSAAKLSNPLLMPLECKRLGRLVKNFDPDVWEIEKCQIMKRGLYDKFSQNDDLLEALLSTKSNVLVEASTRDNIWGAGIHASKASDVHQWSGQNLLGFCLMEVRDVLQLE